MWESLICMTATYSNAVLVAMLPYANDFSKKLDLPIPLPITTNQILSAKICMDLGKPDGFFILTNGFKFDILSEGYVCMFDSPKNFYPRYGAYWDDLSPWVGTVNMTTNEAIEMARETIKKLGYKLEWFGATNPPKHFSEPFMSRKGLIPFCDISWAYQEDDIKRVRNSIEVYINMETKTVVGMTTFFDSRFDTALNKFTPIKVDIVPELEIDRRIRANPDVIPPELRGRAHMTPAYSNAVVAVSLPYVNDLAKRLDLPIPLLLTTNQIFLTIVSRYPKSPDSLLRFTNGYDFVMDSRGYCIGLQTTESYFPRGEEEYVNNETDEELAKYVGTASITTNQAIEMAREAIKKLGYKLEDFGATNPPNDFDFPTKCRLGIIPYCKVSWEAKKEESERYANSAQFSINMKDKTFVRIEIALTDALVKAYNLKPIQPSVVPEMEFDYRKRMLQQKGLLPTNNPPNALPFTRTTTNAP